MGPQAAEWGATSDYKVRCAMRKVSGTVLDTVARAVEQIELARQWQDAPPLNSALRQTGAESRQLRKAG